MQEIGQINYCSHTQEQCVTVKNNNRLTHLKKIIYICNNRKNLMHISSYHKIKQRENQQGSTEVSYLQEVGCGMKWKGRRKEGHFSEDTKLDAGTYSQKN